MIKVRAEDEDHVTVLQQLMLNDNQVRQRRHDDSLLPGYQR